MRRRNGSRVGAEIVCDHLQHRHTTAIVEFEIGFGEACSTLPGRDFAAQSGRAFIKLPVNAVEYLLRGLGRLAGCLCNHLAHF